MKNLSASRNIYIFYRGESPISNHIIYCMFLVTSNDGRNREGVDPFFSLFHLSIRLKFPLLNFVPVRLQFDQSGSLRLSCSCWRAPVFFVEVLPPIVRICHVEYVRQVSSQLRLIINARVYWITGSAEMVTLLDSC